MGEVDRLRAELEQEREARHAAESLNAGRVVEARENWSARVDALEAELEQARKELQHEVDERYKAETGWTDTRAELEQARKDIEIFRDDCISAEDELEQARKEYRNGLVAAARACEHVENERDAQTCPHSNCDAQRYRDALERIADEGLDLTSEKVARDALAGDQ